MRKPRIILIGSLWILAGLSALLFYMASARTTAHSPVSAATVDAASPASLTPLYKVGTFAMTDHHGDGFSNAHLDGKAWVGFIFLRNCPTGSCPTMINKMAELQKALPAESFGENVQFVSFSIDPERDTPERLAEYALNASKAVGRDEVDPRWHLLTGTHEQVRQVSQAMRLGFDAETFDHNTQFLLVDGEGRVRGVYRNSVDEDMQRLAADARQLLDR